MPGQDSGTPPPAGATLRRPDLAATLQGIADSGRDAFYTGRVAAQIAAATGGVLTTADLDGNRTTKATAWLISCPESTINPG